MASKIKNYLSGIVLEAGAGLGANLQYLNQEKIDRWMLMEPDERLFLQLSQKNKEGSLPANCEIRHCVIDELPANESFDAILYLDVIEHIKNDTEEILKALDKLKAGGYLILLVPAHPFLFSPFDRAIGHYRRYSKKQLVRLFQNSKGSIIRVQYIDSGGFFLSLANRYFLKSPQPGLKQILFWDRFVIRWSRIFDHLCHGWFGRSLVMVWQKQHGK